MTIRSKEAIRNKILEYAHVVWDVNRTDHLHPLIHLIIEEVSNELYLLDNKLHAIDTSILEKLVETISPTQFDFVRPGSTVIQVRPNIKNIYLPKASEFFAKEVPDYLVRKHVSSVVFSPIMDMNLYDMSISYLFIGDSLWAVDELGSREQLATTNHKLRGNKLWLGIQHNTAIKYVEDLYFYLDFPHLNSSHEYYDVFSLLKWKAEGKTLKVDAGLVNPSKEPASRAEKDAIAYYKIHYQTVRTRLNLGNAKHHKTPTEIKEMLDETDSESLSDVYWVSIEFPSYFLEEDIKNIQVLLNAFPVMNSRYVYHTERAEALGGVIALPSEIGEEYSELVRVQDSNKRMYSSGDTTSRNKQGVYSIKPVRKKHFVDTKLQDYLELFVDVVERERAVFPKLDRDMIIEIQRSVSSLTQEQNSKIGSNVLNDFAEVGHLNINSFEEVDFMDIVYTTTLADLANEVPLDTILMANKVAALNNIETRFVTHVRGGRTFYKGDSMKAVNHFYITSRGRILTKHDIISFCKMEIGDYAMEIDVIRAAKIGSKPGEGIINAMEIQITPKEKAADFFNQKGVLRELRLRLIKYSPSHYNYVFKIKAAEK